MVNEQRWDIKYGFKNKINNEPCDWYCKPKPWKGKHDQNILEKRGEEDVEMDNIMESCAL